MSIAAAITCFVTLGISWILYPAWVVFLADQLEWTVEDLSSGEGEKGDDDDADDDNDVVLSLVIPAYNEEDRISIMLQDAYGYLESPNGIETIQKLQDLNIGRKYRTESSTSSSTRRVVEWLIVNDGSKDCTCDAVRTMHQKLCKNITTIQQQNTRTTSSKLYHRWKIVSLTQNSGKGAAVQTGMGLATGSFQLMVDADGATEFGPGLEKLVNELHKLPTTTRGMSTTAAFGSRAHLQEEATAQRSFVRTLLMKAFHFFVSMFVSSKIQDTQCGFKLFAKEASRAVFGNLHLRRWAFDTEVVLLCDRLEIVVLEVGVPWHEVDGSKLSTSKLSLAIVSITMLRDMICVRTCYSFGIWRIKKRT